MGSPLSSKTANAVVYSLLFNSDGLVPAIAQQHDTGEILMMAWMNEDAVRETLDTNQVCYWSRSRSQLWRKGETSGQTQKLVDFRWDCDSDTILLQVDQLGVACHTGRRNCFYNAVRDDEIAAIAAPEVNPDDIYS
ncbi:MAG: phosphoribosyl-AMP cyclohydrolase [Rhodospirillales bacterium]